MMSYKYFQYEFSKKYHRILNYFIRYLYRDDDHDSRKSILLVGSARSGTTWLANIIASHCKSRLIFEPFNPNLVPEYSKYNYFQYMRSDDYDQDLYDFCSSIFTGNIRGAWVDREVKYLHPRGRVIKSIRSGLMLRWIDNYFPEVTKLLMIRHPCAVVRSRLKLGWATDSDINNFICQPKLISDFLEDKMEIIANVETEDQKHAIIWCILNFVPIKQFQGLKLNVVNYENLVQNPVEEIQRIFQLIGESHNEVIFRDMKRPSFTSTHISAILTGKSITEQWKKDLSRQQIDRILSIVEEFGLSYLYDTSSSCREFTQ